MNHRRERLEFPRLHAAAAALALGLADYCVPLTEVRHRATELATEIAQSAPLAIVATRPSVVSKANFGDCMALLAFTIAATTCKPRNLN